MAVKTTRWTLADSLRTEAEAEHMLELAIAEEDQALVLEILGIIARKFGMSKIARKTGLGRESLYKALSVGGNPEFATVMKVIHALGLRLKVASLKPAAE